MASSARIDELRKKFDENPRRYFAPLANEYRKAGDLEQAIFICQEYLPQQPGHMSGHIVYGQALFELGRHEEARVVFETALSLDPENLIALRHLGDIARQSGDMSTARTWYQRVLEADPRNEEIAQIMMSLLTPATPAQAVPAAPTPSAMQTPPPIPAVDHNAPTPLSSASVPPPIPQAPPALEVEKSSDAAMAPPPPPVPPPAVPPPAKKEEELLDLDNFDLGGVPLSTLRASKPVVAAEVNDPDLSDDTPTETATQGAASGGEVEQSEEVSLESTPEASGEGLLDEAFEADPFAIAAGPRATSSPEPTPSAVLAFDETPAEPPIELATDLQLGLPDDGTTATTLDAATAALDGLETFEQGVIASAKEVEPVPIDAGSFFDTPPAPPPESGATSTAPESPPSGELADAGRATVEPATAFVTETMAELYLQQGHLESALDIYRKLVEMHPDDAALQSRLDAVEQQIFGTTRQPTDAVALEDTATATATPEATPEATAAATPTAYGGPTIREFLSDLVNRAPTPVEAQPVVVPEARPAPPLRPTPSSSQTVSESLDVFFGGADAAAPDATAANTLAEAFAPEGPETAPLQGMPAHRASNELSLDHVFKGGSPPAGSEGAADNFSFDQFFSAEADEAPEPGAEGSVGATPEASDDIAQFNAWLNGLKKT